MRYALSDCESASDPVNSTSGWKLWQCKFSHTSCQFVLGNVITALLAFVRAERHGHCEYIYWKLCGRSFVEMLKLFLRVWSRFIWIHTTNTLGEQGVALVSHFHLRSIEHVLQASTSAQSLSTVKFINSIDNFKVYWMSRGGLSPWICALSRLDDKFLVTERNVIGLPSHLSF